MGQGKGVRTLDAASLGLNSADSLPELLQLVTDKARELIRAHQATASVVADEKWTQASHAVSLSDKYAAWREYDERPDGSGIYRLVCQLNRPMRLTQAELEPAPGLARVRPSGRSPPAYARMAGRAAHWEGRWEYRAHPAIRQI